LLFQGDVLPGYLTVNRRYVYAALHWCTNHYAEICDTVRELMGAGVFQVPADSSVLDDPEIRQKFETYWATPHESATSRMKLFRLAWDLLSSEFAGRYAQYEKFYAGPSFVMNSYSASTAPWDDWSGQVERLLASYGAMGDSGSVARMSKAQIQDRHGLSPVACAF
jgi:4-hydroxyphenylacetate 3-monooxygenase